MFASFRTKNVYLTLGFEPQAPITVLNVEFSFAEFHRSGNCFSTDIDHILSLSVSVLQNRTIYVVLGFDLTPFKRRGYQ